mgnify:CR=1 FL=1
MAYMESVETAFVAVQEPRVLWGMSAPDAWDAAEQGDTADGWERSFASDGDGVISFSELPPLPPMEDLRRAAVLLEGVPSGTAELATLCSSAEGVTLLKRFSPSDVLGNGFWPRIREGLLLGMHDREHHGLASSCALLLSEMFNGSAASTPGTAAEILAGWLQHRMCSEGGVQSHDELLTLMLGSLEDVWKNAVVTVQDTLFVALCQQADLWTSQLWQCLLHRTWPRGAMPQWLLLTGSIHRSLVSLGGGADATATPPQAMALLEQAAAAACTRDAVAGAAIQVAAYLEKGAGTAAHLWPPATQYPPHASLLPSLEAARRRISEATGSMQQVQASSCPALQQAAQEEIDPWSVSDDLLQGLTLVSEDVLAEDAAVNGLLRSTDPGWCRGVIRHGQHLPAVSSALGALQLSAPSTQAADALCSLQELLCPEGGLERELSLTASARATSSATSASGSGAASPLPVGATVFPSAVQHVAVRHK